MVVSSLLFIFVSPLPKNTNFELSSFFTFSLSGTPWTLWDVMTLLDPSSCFTAWVITGVWAGVSTTGLVSTGLPVTKASTFSRYVLRRGSLQNVARGFFSAGDEWSNVPFICPVCVVVVAGVGLTVVLMTVLAGVVGGAGGGGGGGGLWWTGSRAVLWITLLSPASCLIFSFSPMRLRASYVLIGGLLRDGSASSSASSDGEALAQVTDGEPPLLCLITSLVGCIGVEVCIAVGFWVSAAGAGQGEEETEATEGGTVWDREEEEETYSSAEERGTVIKHLSGK